MIDIDTSTIEVDEPLLAAAAAIGTNPIDWVLTGGDDHALVATFPPDTELPQGFSAIGVVNARDESAPVVQVDGKPWHGSAGFEHFS